MTLLVQFPTTMLTVQFPSVGMQGPPGPSSGDATSLQGIPISDAEPANGQVLTYNGSEYVPVTPGTTADTGRIVIDSGPVTMTASDEIVEIAQTTPAACTVNLPISPVPWKKQTVVDGANNAATYPITLFPPSGTIDVAVIRSNGGALTFYWNGANFKVIS